MNKTKKNRVSYLSVLALTVFSLIFISAVTSFAFQKPGMDTTVQPMILIEPGLGGGGPSSDIVEPIDCKDRSGYRDCYRSKTRYCPGTLERDGGPEACYSNAVDQCYRTYCQ